MKRVVVGIISRSREKDGKKEYLLVSSKKNFEEYSGAYYPPGGHLEEGEGEKEGLAREIMEELGIQAKPIEKVAETLGDVENQTTCWWRCDRIVGDIKVNSDEIADAKFFTEEELKTTYLWPATRNFFEENIDKLK